MTLNACYAHYCIMCASYEAHRTTLTEGGPVLSATKMSRTVVSCGIRFVWIFAGVFRRGGVERQCGGWKQWFSCFQYRRIYFASFRNKVKILLYVVLIRNRCPEWSIFTLFSFSIGMLTALSETEKAEKCSRGTSWRYKVLWIFAGVLWIDGVRKNGVVEFVI